MLKRRVRAFALVFIIAVMAVFFIQNLAATEVAFLVWVVAAPRAIVFSIIFALGLAAGYLLVALRRLSGQ